MQTESSVDPIEVDKFKQHAAHWWDTSGPFKTLHDVNSCRLAYIEKTMKLKGQPVLDLGCGGGILSEGLAKRGATVTGLDVEADAIDTAREHADKSTLSIEYVCSPVESFQGGPFEAIICMEMLEHVADPNLIISTAANLLAPGGYLFLSTLNRTPKAYGMVILAAEYLLGLLPRQTHDYAKFLKPSELSTLLKVAGFELIDISGMRYNPMTRQASLDKSVAVNYMLTARKL